MLVVVLISESIEREKASILVDVRGSKNAFVKLLNISLHVSDQLVYDQDIKTNPDVIEYVLYFISIDHHSSKEASTCSRGSVVQYHEKSKASWQPQVNYSQSIYLCC